MGPFQSMALADGTPVQGLFNLPAFLIVLVVTAILIVGVRESANVNSVIVFVKVGVVISLIILGIRFIVPANWSPFIPPNTGSFGHFGWSGILTGAGKIFFAYIGFDAVSTAAQEAKNPQRDLPRGILGSLVVCTLLYVLFAAVLTGIVPYTQLDGPAPVAIAVDRMQMPFMGQAMKLGAIAGLTSVMLVMLYSQARIFWIMSSDGLLPKAFSKLHARFRTPYLSSLLTGVAVAVAGGVFPIGTLGDMVSIGTLFAFVLVCAGVLVLRRTKPDLKRPFRTPFVPVVPILGMLCCLGLMSGLGLHTWERLFIWLAIGLVIYFALRPLPQHRPRTEGLSPGCHEGEFTSPECAGCLGGRRSPLREGSSALDRGLRALFALPDLALDLDQVRDAEGERGAGDVPDRDLLDARADDADERHAAAVDVHPDRRVQPGWRSARTAGRRRSS